MSITPQVRVNGNAPRPDGTEPNSTFALATASIALTLASTTGISSLRWEVSSAPAGSTCAVATAAPTTPFSTTAGPLDVAGTYLLKAIANDDADSVYEFAVTVLTTTALRVPARGERLQWDPVYSWEPAIKDIAEGAGGGGGSGAAIAGDLLGTGSVLATPRVGSLTGITGVVAVLGGAALSFGTNPAATGYVRAPTTSTIVAARNAANSADVPVLATDASDRTILGNITAGSTIVRGLATITVTAGANTALVASTTSVVLYASNVARLTVDALATFAVPIVLPGASVATVGDIRGAYNTTLLAVRNATVDVSIIRTDASTNLLIGENSVVNQVLFYGASYFFNTPNSTRLYMDGTQAQFNVPIIVTATAGHLALPGTVAATGDIRAANATTILAARNAANSADIALVATDASNNAFFGMTAAGGSAASTAYLAGSTVILYSGAARVTVSASLATFAVPIALQSTPVSATGDIRAAANTTILAVRNAANSADLSVIGTTSDDIVFGGVITCKAASAAVSFGTVIELTGANRATVGNLRASNATTILAARNAANDANMPLVSTDASNYVYFGAFDAAVVRTYVRSAGNVVIEPSGGTATFTSTGLSLSNGVGFYGTAHTTKQSATGSRGGNAALASLLAALAAYGFITDSTTA